MKIRTTLSLLLLAALVAGGCSHTNNLAKYSFSNSKILFRARTSGTASSFAGINNPVKDNAITGIIAAIGSGIVSDEGRRKLEKAIDRDTIANAIANGMQRAVTDYLNVQPVNSIADEPEFLVETDLTDYTIVSLSEGLFVKAKGKSRMIHRATGAVVWENSESHTIPLSQTYLAGLAPAPVSSGVSIYNAVQLLNLSQEELRTVFSHAATEVGEEIGETLREDIADIRAGK
jgi:hypothetical protein